MTNEYKDAIKNRIGTWLPLAEKRRDELRVKIDRARNERPRAAIQIQYDELDAQIEAAKRELNEADRR